MATAVEKSKTEAAGWGVSSGAGAGGDEVAGDGGGGEKMEVDTPSNGGLIGGDSTAAAAAAPATAAAAGTATASTATPAAVDWKGVSEDEARWVLDARDVRRLLAVPGGGPLAGRAVTPLWVSDWLHGVYRT